jgi:hypothetical protein
MGRHIYHLIQIEKDEILQKKMIYFHSFIAPNARPLFWSFSIIVHFGHFELSSFG